ncbi:WD40-repeat-containing domain protein [Haematococcus lacustris]
MSADAFSRPQLEPMASAWQEGEAGHPHAWSVPVDPARRAFRVREIELGMLRSRTLSAPKLREQVYSVETGSEGVCALAFHPYHPLLCAADTRGFIKVSNFNDSTNINAFHVTNGMPLHDTRAPYLPSTINFLHHVNEADGPMLLAGSTDGAVRVWRSHTLPGSQRMATALQAVTIHLPPQQGRNTAFAWCRHKSHLFAAGGSHPDMIYCWDLMYEMCSNMIPMNMTPSAATTGTMPVVAVDRIMLGSDPSLLLAACNDATLRLFDIRASRVAAMVLAPFKQPPAGVAFELAGRQGIIAAASERGELKLMDIRQAYSAMSAASAAGAPMPGMAELSATATYKTVAAHSKGGVTALVAHAYAPLLATGTTNQVVKVWTESCEVVGAIRAQNMLSSNKVGSVTSMAWHPYQPLLAAGGSDSVCTVYAIDQNTSAAAGRSIGPSSTTQYSATSSAASFG